MAPKKKQSQPARAQSAAAGSSYHHGDLKPALVAAAREILEGPKGVAGLSLRSIAAAIGVSHMAPYAHFKSKQQLLLAVAVAGFEELAVRMLAARTDRHLRGRELAVNYGLAYLEFALAHPELYRVMMSQIDPDSGPAAPDSKNAEEANSDNASDSDDSAGAASAARASLRRPFLLLYAAFKNSRLDKATARARAIGAWSTVHGMAALLIDGHLAVPEGMDVAGLFKTAVGSRQ